LLLDSFALSPWFPEFVCAASVLVSAVFAVPAAVVPLASLPVATAASPAAVAGAAEVDSPGAAELDSGGAAVIGVPEVPGALFSGALASAGAAPSVLPLSSVFAPPGVTVA